MRGRRNKTITDSAPSGRSALIPSNRWIIGPREDMVLFIGTPLLLIATFAVAQQLWSLTALTVFATVLAMGHYLPGLMRAYGDPALFRRFWLRFLLTPLFFMSIAVYAANHESQVFLMVVVVWGAWHWLMQSYGLVRIYDAKAKNFDAASARLDYALCIAWFGVVYWRTDGASAVLMHFYRAGGHLAPGLAQWGIRLWIVGTGVITVMYLVHLIRRLRAGHPPSLLKLGLLSVTFAFYYYAFGYTSSKLIAYSLFEGYHDIQYLAIVWVFNRNRATQGSGAGAFTRFLFRQRAPLAILYVALCLGFGSYDYFARMLDEGALARAALGVITGLALVHFYFDGFIWRIREPATRATLGVAGDDSGKTGPRLPSYVLHGLVWAVFLVPLLSLAAWETAGGTPDDVSACQAVLQVQPDSHKTHYLLASVLAAADKRDEALSQVRRSRELRPGYDLYDMLYADQMLARGQLTDAELDEIILCYQRAAVTRPGVVELHRNWAHALTQRGRFEDAEAQYRIALALDPNDAETHNNHADVLARLGELDQAADAYLRALQLDPRHVESHAVLGMIRMAQKREKDAIEHFRLALGRDSDRMRILSNFAVALATADDAAVRDPEQAARLADQAVRSARESDDPLDQSAARDPGVWQNLAAAYAAAGRFDAAAKAAQRAADLYQAGGQSANAAQIAETIRWYQSGRKPPNINDKSQTHSKNQ